MDSNVKYLLQIIKYTPSLTILIVCILTITLMFNEQKKEFLEEQNLIEKQFVDIQKEKIKSAVNTVHDYIKREKNRALDELKQDLNYKMNTAYNIAINIYNKNKDKKTKAEIIEQIKESIEVLRFNDARGYFSIHTLDGINILQPINRSFEGTSVFYRKDIKGNYPVQMAIEIAKTKGTGFFSWYYYKPNDKSKEFEKIGIVKKFEPYNLIFTTAEYVEDFNNNLQKKILEHISYLKFDNNDFIFLINYNGEVLLHKSDKVINHNIFKENKFSHVKSFFEELINNKINEDSAYLRTIPKITEGENTKEIKITYAKKFDDWKWIIAQSFKLSSSQKLLEDRKNILEKKYSHYKNNVLIYGVFFTIILLLISYFISKLLENIFLKYKKSLENKILENKTQKEILLKAQEVAQIGDWRLDINTNKAFWSDEIIKILGLDKKDKDKFGPEYLKKLMIDEDIPCFENSINKCIENGSEHQCIYRIKRADGEIRWIDCRGKLDKDKSHIIGTVQDITKRKILEIEKKQKEDLLFQQSKMAAMGEMLGNIAHQWRQPLSNISIASTGTKIQKEMNCLSDEQLYSALTSINDSAQYLSQTIEDFRSFFNPSDNKMNKFFIDDCLNKTLSLVKTQFISKNIEIIKNIENFELLSIENELIQVLINILNNARDSLVINQKEKKLIFINTYKKEDISYIEILDNAGGIENNIIDRIFEPYFTTKHKSQGTGIGLYMSEEIVRTHLNGNITASNEKYLYDGIEYKGAKFTITI